MKSKLKYYAQVIGVNLLAALAPILLSSKNSYQDNTFYDGTPFGIKVEE